MLVLAAGMMRSGSTWQFNVLRILVQMKTQAGCESRMFTPNMRLSESPCVVKIHPYQDWIVERADFIFTCHRDIRDACASLQRFHPARQPPAHQKIEEEFTNYQRWAQVADFDMRYESMISDPHGQIEKMSNILGLRGVNVDTIYEKVHAIKPPLKRKGSREDPITLLWPGHITGSPEQSFKDTLSKDVIVELERKFGWWLKQQGYVSE